MTSSGRHGLAMLAALAALGGEVLAQDQAQVVIDRGLTEDLPYTAIYPNVLHSVDDGSPVTILTLRHPEVPLQCDAFAVAGAGAGWSAEAALRKLDVAGIEATWAPDFPGFRIVSHSVTRFASGPALLYEGESDNSPLGIPLRIVHAEAVDAGRTYAIECLMEKSIAADARPLIDFFIANFSTRSDGQCCINPADERG
ncbi:MAG: hypothetical protein Q8L54_04045 [Devosia sp.]|nr:hypothetical protein [Devosia sp.]